jgi:dephospho-CoA kinase
MSDLPFVVAVTGGIASGKSAVTERFARLGVPVIDADLIARELVETGEPALQAIAERFGAVVLTSAGQLDRRALRGIIFADAAARLDLEAILHPRIRACMHERARNCGAAYVMLAIPLLTASSGYGWVDRVLVVDVAEAVQIERLMRRDGVDETAARAALAAQISRTERLALADDVIDNSDGLDALDDAVEALHRRYLERAGAAGRAGLD